MSAKEFAHHSKKYFFFPTWSICRNCVVNGIIKRLRATKGNPVSKIPKREWSGRICYKRK
jgi:hypothetical protein